MKAMVANAGLVLSLAVLILIRSVEAFAPPTPWCECRLRWLPVFPASRARNGASY